MGIKKPALVGGGIFLVIVTLAVCVSAKFSLLNITSDPYAFITSFFSQWSPALSAAATLIVAIIALYSIYETRRTIDIERQSAIQALYDEIYLNKDHIEELVSELREFKAGEVQDAPFRPIDIVVFDTMKNEGHLPWLQEARRDVIYIYSIIRTYNSDGSYKEYQETMLDDLLGNLEDTLASLEAKFKFLPRDMKEKSEDSKAKHSSTTTATG